MQKAQTAKQENEEAKELELIKLAVSAAQIEGEGTITTENLNNKLRTNFSDNEISIENPSYWYYKEYRIYKDGHIETGIPKEYQQVKYIESSGTQWIDTGKLLGYSNCFLLRVNASYWSNVTFGKNSNGRECYFRGDRVNLNGKGLNINLLTNTWYDIIFDTTDGNASFYANDELILESSGTNNHGKVYLFGGCNNYSSYDIDNFSKYKLESFKTYNNEELEQDYVPCYRKSDNEIGMYDLVSNTFFTNAGTGKFGYELKDGTYVAPQ